MQAEQQRLKAADSVVVIGGGPVGVEVAAEILTDLPGAIETAAGRSCRASCNVHCVSRGHASSTIVLMYWWACAACCVFFLCVV